MIKFIREEIARHLRSKMHATDDELLDSFGEYSKTLSHHHRNNATHFHHKKGNIETQIVKRIFMWIKYEGKALSSSEADRVIHSIDVNGDHLVTAKEFRSWLFPVVYHVDDIETMNPILRILHEEYNDNLNSFFHHITNRKAIGLGQKLSYSDFIEAVSDLPGIMGEAHIDRLFQILSSSDGSKVPTVCVGSIKHVLESTAFMHAQFSYDNNTNMSEHNNDNFPALLSSKHTDSRSSLGSSFSEQHEPPSYNNRKSPERKRSFAEDQYRSKNSQVDPRNKSVVGDNTTDPLPPPPTPTCPTSLQAVSRYSGIYPW